ncbi:hypothetical protein E5347_10700 [Clostridium sartagoforme]|uniref:Uncharacterized protein n=1 Tax=Clostridium sartagoforme TaxID=84031 RepID=A0A4S2DLA9_9CLOT|nr:hypothetical protein [Clostridium sartagoforme]TGY41783.1 hypothetical protein E5347_10700 [Clostridium sartagoforme]
MTIRTNEEIAKDNIKKLLNELDNYSFEVIITDIWCLYNTMSNKINYNYIFITPERYDFGIDSIIIPENNISLKDRSCYLIQISKSRKSMDNLKKFLDKSSMKNYNDIIPNDCINEKRVLITLKRSNLKNHNIEVISDENLIDIVYKVGINYNLIDGCGVFIREYISNIEFRAELWELVNIYRKKRKFDIMDKYINILMLNYELIKQKSFTMLESINSIIDQKMKETLDYITLGDDKEKYKAIIMTKFSVVADDNCLNDINNVNELVKFLLERICYDMSKYQIVPRCTYLSLKHRKSNSVIAYFSYKYNKNAESYNFGFKCTMEDISKKYHNDIRIRKISKEDKGEKVSDSCNFNTPLLFNKPNLVNDKELIKELLIESEKSVMK